MPEKLLFTMAKLNGLKPPRTGRRTVYDEKTPGLTICITAAGGKSYYLYGRFGGKPRRVRIGGFPDLDVATAREQASKLVTGFINGNDPTETKRKQRGELTLGGLWALYLEFHGPHKKASSLTEDGRLWKRYLSAWNGRKLSSITNAEVQKWHSRLGRDHGKYAANRALALLSMLFSVAKDHGEWKQLNPCEGVKKFAEKSRDRFLQPDELPRLLDSLNADPDQRMASVFRLCLMTGARKGNVIAMRWDEIDLEAGIWRIPDTKAGEPQRVPLVTEAISLLKAMKSTASSSPYVFPGREAGAKVGHVQNTQRAWQVIIDRAELPGLRIHDLRRSMGSWQALQGASLKIIGAGLGHKHTSTTEIYAHLTLDPVRQSMQKAASAMLATARTAEQPADDDGPAGVG